MPELFDAIARHYTLPPGGSWETAKHHLVGGEPGLIQRAGVEQAVAYASICQWTVAWLDGGSAERRAATRVLRRVPGWPMIVDHDGGALVVALAALGETDRELIMLSTWDGLTSAEIGELLGIRAATARVRLHRARRRLEELLEPHPHSIAEMSRVIEWH